MTQHSTRGFTLIEIIIALFIFALVSLMISYGLNSVFNAKEKITKIENRLNELQFALTLMQHDTSQLIDYNAPANPVSTTGNNTEFSFTTTDNANPMGLEQRGNLMQVSYLWTHHQLIRKIWFDESTTKKTYIFSRILLTNITNFKFRYLTPSGFIDTWPPPNLFSQTAPLAVQINFTIPGWGDISQLYRTQGDTLAIL